MRDIRLLGRSSPGSAPCRRASAASPTLASSLSAHPAIHHPPSSLQDLARTRFCLAPTGGGHGHRQILVTFSGCVPLLIGEFGGFPRTIQTHEMFWALVEQSLAPRSLTR